ncbi:RNA polymerase sigma factor [Fibrella forsythiae]|uniref:RNA polymerase sigma factor n=1 Tax=Fibrella forsythiae TaxID=2817061 RepID=A0ABS3JCT7_9BACT|nr:RNA polymerase sigma factor [Fibrella forsythiae]MBO0947814.1 RNA polymerase sigma factor [Fibrella forsythiae]
MPQVPDLTVLLNAIGQGDEGAFRQLYDLTKGRVYNTALGYVRNREDAEEITQDVYIEAFRSLGTFNREASVTTWLYRITVNKSIDFVRHQQRQKRFAFLTSLFNPKTGAVEHDATEAVHPGVLLEHQENAQILFRAIDKLADKQKTAYILTRVEGLNNMEAAAVMNITVGAVESLLQRANATLKKQLANWYNSIRP